MEELLKKWKTRAATFRAEAEASFFAQNGINVASIDALHRQHHYETCLRQWNIAIEELEAALNEN